jgi:hypothetical protein
VTLSRVDLIVNEARAHAQEQCHAYRDVIRNDRIALAHWSNAGASKSLTDGLQGHLTANLQRLAYWEAFLNSCSESTFFRAM